MSEIPAPPEVANEAEIPPEEILAPSPKPTAETQKSETEKNNDIQRLFKGFHESNEYRDGLEKHKQHTKPGALKEMAVIGYEAQMTTPEKPLLGTGEYYKKAFMEYMGRFYEENGVWPLYFSEAILGPEITEAYTKYKEAAIVSKNVENRVHVLTDAELDEKRSFAHDNLAAIFYNQGLVKTFLDGKLAARLWLVTEGIEGPESIVYMDQARIQRAFHYLRNKENEGPN